MAENLDFSKCKILIVGDIMLDKYYFGKVERISPEAPVPIVNIAKEESRLGGAANVAHNISSLGGKAYLYGAVGYDHFGKEIERMAKKERIQATFVKSNQPTITKARVIGGRQQIVRLDYEQKLSLNETAQKNFVSLLRERIPGVDLLIISDYGKGLISEEICSFLIQTAQQHSIPVIVDPKGKNWRKYKGANLITPNIKELGDILGKVVVNEDKAIEEAAQEIIRQYALSALLVTRSEKGMSLITSREVSHIPTHSQAVFDVSGAGDTVVATLSLAFLAGKNITEAMQIANIAAGIVVKKIGTATLSIIELNEQLQEHRFSK